MQFAARPGFQKSGDSASSAKSFLEPVPTEEDGTLLASYVLEDPESHFIYICRKADETSSISNISDDS